MREVRDDERLWGFIAWLIPLVGGVVSLVLRPEYKYAKYWAYLSISFFIVIVVAEVVGYVLSLIPIIGWIFSILINVGLFVVWIVGVVRSLEKTWWKPPLIYDIAKRINPSL